MNLLQKWLFSRLMSLPGLLLLTDYSVPCVQHAFDRSSSGSLRRNPEDIPGMGQLLHAVAIDFDFDFNWSFPSPSSSPDVVTSIAAGSLERSSFSSGLPWRRMTNETDWRQLSSGPSPVSPVLGQRCKCPVVEWCLAEDEDELYIGIW